MEKILLSEFKKRCSSYSTFAVMRCNSNHFSIYKNMIVMMCPNRICFLNGNDIVCIDCVEYIEWHHEPKPWFSVVALDLNTGGVCKYTVKIF